MQTNVAAKNKEKTFEGGRARTPKASEQLERQVATCMLFEDTFYQKGNEIAEDIRRLAGRVPVRDVAALAIKARNDFKLRHVPLFLLAQLDRRRSELPGLLAATIPQVVQRPDEMGELLSIIKKESGKELKKSLSAQVKKGLAAAFQKFGFYALSKWNQDAEIKLRDVLFLVHAKPENEKQAELWKKLIDGTLEAPDTWEVALSVGKDKKETWERLLAEEKLGYMALLMNLRNMEAAGVNKKLVEQALLAGAKGSRALPFRFINAAKHAPSFANAVSEAMLSAVSAEEKLPGKTYIMVDTSGSMSGPVSGKSKLNRDEAAAALAVLIREISEEARVFPYANNVGEVANYRGLPLADRIIAAGHGLGGGTETGSCARIILERFGKPDRLIIVTDEQAWDALPAAQGFKGYVMNVAPYRPGMSFEGDWTRINGFSERVVDWIRYEEGLTS